VGVRTNWLCANGHPVAIIGIVQLST
jgi:hypothetical protein